MSQSISNANSGDLDAHWRDLRLKPIEWHPAGDFTTSDLTNLDCRVPSAKINSARPEICGDGIDNDCNGWIDDGPQCLAPPSLEPNVDWWRGMNRRVKG